MEYVKTFSQFTVIFIFTLSLAAKIRNFNKFKDAIKNFQILPLYFHHFTAIVFLFAEFVILFTGVIGGDWLFLSYSLSIVLLILFVFALNSALRRQIQTSCNCFGSSEKAVSHYDIWRNIFIIFISVAGLFSLFITETNILYLTGSELFIPIILAAVVSMLILNLREIADLFS